MLGVNKHADQQKSFFAHVFIYLSLVFRAQDKEFVVSEEMNKYRLCEIVDGGHFFVHDAEGGDLALIEAKLKELKDKVCALLLSSSLLRPLLLMLSSSRLLLLRLLMLPLSLLRLLLLCCCRLDAAVVFVAL